MVQCDKKKSSVTFIFNRRNIASASVAGDFNDWDPAVGKMTKAKDGSFKARFTMAPGAHEYKFFVDGMWVVDESNDIKVQNIFGTFNSVVKV